MAWTQRDNTDLAAKLLVREAALQAAGDRPGVLDLFAGQGHMYRHVWGAAAGAYLGVDKLYSRPAGDPAGECWRGENELLVVQAMAHARGSWDIVDLDAYANPWPLLRRVLRLSAARRLVVTATCGIIRPMRTGSSDFACAVSGASQLTYTGILSRWYRDVIRWAVAWASDGTGYVCRRGASLHSEGSTRPGQQHYWLLEFCRVAQRKLLSE